MKPDASVVVVGEALVDLIPRSDGALSPRIGGGPFNTARAVARLGGRAVFVGRVSRDAYGEEIAEALAQDEVGLDPRLRTERPTSLAMAQLDAAGAATYRFYFSGTSAEDLTAALALATTPVQARALHVGGLGLVLTPMAEAVEAVVERLAGQVLVMVDPNVRPAVIEDMAAYAARLDRVMGKADVVKVSEEDLQVLAPDTPPRVAARALLEKGPALVLLTLGPAGAVAIGAFGELDVPSPRVEVVDTIGAGDTFSGAWLAQWRGGREALGDAEAVLAATQRACRAAAISCARAGASPPRLGEL